MSTMCVRLETKHNVPPENHLKGVTHIYIYSVYRSVGALQHMRKYINKEVESLFVVPEEAACNLVNRLQ